jgi:DNA-binding PadR family transcriptional regulator
MNCAIPFPLPWFFASSRWRADDCCDGPHGRPHHGPPPWLHEFLGWNSRAERGEVRYLVLDALKEGPRHGYEVIQAIEQRSGGRYRPSPGTVYPTLQMLEEIGHVRCEAEPQGNRKVYAITDEGREDLKKHALEVDEAYSRWGTGPEMGEGFDFHDIAMRFRRILHAVGTGIHRGRFGQADLAELKRVLDEALDKIESFVSEKLK